ncbi:MAG: hypothetical protein KDD37_05505 [Bdellovibrionales bacterium]|nr:hypothetical protein [Bdellovibrionales bacterium]
MKSIFIAALLTFSSNAFSQTNEDACIQTAKNITEKLDCIHGLTYKEISSSSAKRVFDIGFTQLVDHTKPELGTFTQRLVLIHRSEDEPMVLQTSGYSIFGISEASITLLFQTNQIQVEHRFFSTSTPAVVDWSKLNIKQSADDFHAITVAFKKIYNQAWVNTGASKGGMTSIYHRRFYPDDLVGTVADVAPLSFTTSDQRYTKFVENVGGDAYKECRENFRKIQTQLLLHRDEFLPLLSGNFTQLGSAKVAFEHSVIEAPFYFWQYGNPDSTFAGCNSLPVNGSPQEMFSFLQSIASISDYTDESISRFQSYYFQAATQLGNPDNSTAHLETLRHFEFTIDQYTPKNVSYTYSNEAMHDVANWVKNDADQIIFIYGEFDPWSAGEFPVSDTGKMVEKYYVPKGNHGSKFTALPSAERQLVSRKIAGWLGKAPIMEGAKALVGVKTLEDMEQEVRQKYKLP